MTSTPETPPVEPDEIWADNDRRSAGRYLRVTAVDATHASVVQVAYNEHDNITADLPCCRTIRIRLDRMRPTSNGYRLVRRADGSEV